jgi:nucleoid-associated protein YgaU
MTGRRLTLTTAAMAGIAVALTALSPDPAAAVSTLARAQQTLDTAGPEALVDALVGLLAWGVWGWGALGLLLTAGGALPGAVGVLARSIARHVLPVAVRRSAAIALGVGVGLAAPLVLPPSPAGASPSTVGAPDWPAAPEHPQPSAPGDPADPVPDWPQPSAPDRPATPAASAHVVVPGDCLWDLAEARLRLEGGRPDDAAVAAATHAWWTANASVIGADPDLLLPGQVLHAPDRP